MTDNLTAPRQGEPQAEDVLAESEHLVLAHHHNKADGPCVSCVVLNLRAEVVRLREERDAEKRRTDVVIAEFDAPWPHSHTVADRLRHNGFVWKIHECRAAIEDKLEVAESRLTQQATALEGLKAAYAEYDAACRRDFGVVSALVIDHAGRAGKELNTVFDLLAALRTTENKP